jgi:hypothetical protein
MAKKDKSSSVKAWSAKAKVSRPGVHAKTKSSSMKNSKNYLKRSRGQG